MEPRRRFTRDEIEKLADRGEIKPHTYRALRAMIGEPVDLQNSETDSTGGGTASGTNSSNANEWSKVPGKIVDGAKAVGSAYSNAVQSSFEADKPILDAIGSDIHSSIEGGSPPGNVPSEPPAPEKPWTGSVGVSPPQQGAPFRGPPEPAKGGVADDSGNGVPPATDNNGTVAAGGENTTTSGPATFDQKTRKELAPEYFNALNTATNNQANEVNKLDQIKKDTYDEIVANQKMQTLAAQAQEREATLNEKRRQEQIQAKYAEVDKALTDARSSKIDANKMFGDMSTGNKIMAAVGMAFGALGASQTGGRNLAVDVLDKAIDRDIEVQKANIANKYRAADAMGGQYARFKEILGDEKAAEAAERLRIHAYWDGLIETAKNSGLSNEMAQNGVVAQAAAKVKMADYNAQLHTVELTTKPLEMKAAKPLEMVDPETQRAFRANEARIEAADRIMELYNKLPEEEKGLIASKKRGLEVMFGMDNSDATLVADKLQLLMMDTLHSRLGTLQKNEIEANKPFMANLANNPATLAIRLKEMKRDAAVANQAIMKDYAGKRSLPNSSYDYEALSGAKQKAEKNYKPGP